MTERSEKTAGNDEIDLIEIFRRFGQSISRASKSLGRAIMVSLVFLVRNWFPLGLSILAGLAISLLMKVTAESFYTSDMTLKANGAAASEMIPYINRLHLFATENNKAAMQDALSLSEAKSGKVLDIQAFWIIDQNKDNIPDYVDYKNDHNVYDTTNIRMDDRFGIRIKVVSVANLKEIRDGIISFLGKDSLFQQKNRMRLKHNAELINRISSDIDALDSLQKIKYYEETKARQPQNGGQMIFLQEQKTQLIYPDIQALFERKQSLESERVLYSDLVTILSDLSLPNKRENGTLYYAISMIPVTFLFTLIVLIILANLKRLRETFSKY